MTLATTRLDVRRIGGRIGAEITGVDLTQPLDEATAGHYTPKAA